MGDLDSIPGLGRSPGGGHDNPLQYSCLGNPDGLQSLGLHIYTCVYIHNYICVYIIIFFQSRILLDWLHHDSVFLDEYLRLFC